MSEVPDQACFSDEALGRSVEIRSTMELGAMATMLYSVPRVGDRADAVAVFPGQGEDWRLSSAVDAWDASQVARKLLVTGVYEGEETYRPITTERLQSPPINMVRTDGVHIQPNARHTREQVDWLMSQVAEGDVSSVALHVSPYHLLRAYCTTIRGFERLGVEPVPVIPVPVAVAPSTIVPETGLDAWDMFNGEAERIAAYRAKGDVATYGQLREYLTWLWEQPILADQAG